MVTIREVCARTGFSRAAVYSRIAAGKLPAKQDDNGVWWVPPVEVEKIMHRLAEPLYSPAEAAALLAFSEEHIRKLLRRGALEGMESCPFPNARKVFREWRIPESDLVRVMRAEPVTTLADDMD
jgi:hypothetical protein